MKSYEAARGLFSFMSFCAWAIIVLGVIIGLMGASAAQSFGGNPNPLQVVLGALPGIVMAISGLLGLAMVQMGRSSVDTAEYAQQSLAVSRDQLEISRQILEQSTTRSASYKTDKRTAPNPTSAFEDDAGVSYADVKPIASHAGENQPAAIETLPDEVPSQPALEQNDQVPLPPVRQEIVYRNGKYLVGEVEFMSRKAAVQHQEDREKLVSHEAAEPQSMPEDGTISYKGQNIEIENQTAYVGRRVFTSMDEAKLHIDRLRK